MADRYEFKLSHNGLSIIVNDPVGPLNDWESKPFDNCLVVESGNVVQADNGNFVLGTTISGGQKILTLFGAGWDSEVGDTGNAEIHLGTCRPRQTWELIRKD